MQQDMHMESVFDKLELGMEMNKSSKFSHEKKPNKNQERWYANNAKVWALHNNAIKLLTWEPLLIVRRLT